MTRSVSASEAVDAYDDLDFVPQDSLPSLEPLPQMPAPPGQNPFRIKGLVLTGLRDFIGTTVPGGYEAVLARIQDPAVLAFMQQRFLTGSWYDILPYVHFLSTAATVARWESARFVGDHGAWQIERDMKGIHRLLLRVASPEKVAWRMGESFARYFDVASVTVVSVEEGKVR